jgi:hypothetical protein
MSDAVASSSASFWRQDVNWYVRQQSFTRSFYLANSSWTQNLQTSNSTALSAPAADGGAPNLADQKLANLTNPQDEQSTSITDTSGQVTSGYLLNLLA